MRRNHLALVLSAALILTTGIPVARSAHAASPTRVYQVAAGELGAALNTLAAQSHIQILYAPELVAGKTTSGVTGEYSIDKALDLLLRGTNLHAETINAGTYVVRASQEDTPPAPSTTNPRNPADSEPPRLGAVQVTAQRRSEQEIDVPIAMNVVTGAQLRARNIGNVVGAINTTAGADAIDAGGAFTQVQIRGVSTSLGGNGSGYYIDNVPFTGVTVPWYPDTRSYDIDSVQILKGPQGTLFGEGSLGGTVVINTRDPEFNLFRAGVELDGSTVSGGGNGWGAKTYLNVPLVDDRLALRVVGTDEGTPGWIYNPTTGEKNVNATTIRTGRAKLRFAATENWTIQAEYWKYKLHSQAGGNLAYDDGTDGGNFATTNSWFSESLTSTWILPGSEVVYTYANGNITFPQSGFLAPGLPFFAGINIGVKTNELRWSSTGDNRFDWTVGYYKRTADRADNIDIPGLISDESRQTNDGYAVYGQATLKLPDPRWAVSAGARYFSDDVDALDTAATGQTSTLSATFSRWSPKYTLSFHPNDRSTIYASASSGFRSGQLQPIASILLAEQAGVALPSSIAPDSIWSYELGGKSVLAGGKMLLQGAIYHSDWKDVAVRVPITNQINGLANSKGTKTNGAEISATYKPIKPVELQVGAAYVHAVYAEDVVGTPLKKGQMVYNVPEKTIYSSASYTWDVGAGLQGVVSGDLHYSSPVETSLTIGTPGDTITLVNLRVGLLDPRRGWSVYLYANNVTGEDGAISARGPTQFDMNGNFLRFGPAYRPQPRTYGAVFRYDY